MPQWMKLYPVNCMKLVHPFRLIYFLCFCPAYLEANFFGKWSWTRHGSNHSFHGNDSIPALVVSERFRINRGPLYHQTFIPVVRKCFPDLAWCMSQPMISKGQDLDACPGPQSDNTCLPSIKIDQHHVWFGRIFSDISAFNMNLKSL